ncbi:hypothetical protein DPMN_155539 [Dreissena polymorpha]|uniref:Uncharacterized protein n=1 Tax=Dreissena polymorpha TaxID=45954 RepID=A0A9D4JBG6_DREPO|nr:hypothetical protein DPMN_155539 [Dreissena polymorpha]
MSFYSTSRFMLSLLYIHKELQTPTEAGGCLRVSTLATGDCQDCCGRVDQRDTAITPTLGCKTM